MTFAFSTSVEFLLNKSLCSLYANYEQWLHKDLVDLLNICLNRFALVNFIQDFKMAVY